MNMPAVASWAAKEYRMPETEPPTLIQRIRHHLRDERINTEEEVDAEINLMTNLELVEVISFCLCGMGARERM